MLIRIHCDKKCKYLTAIAISKILGVVIYLYSDSKELAGVIQFGHWLFPRHHPSYGQGVHLYEHGRFHLWSSNRPELRTHMEIHKV